MPSDFWFRLSTYLSLALSCACLGYAEWEVLPSASVFAAVVVVLLGVSFVLDKRFELGLGKANLVGLGIGILAAGWLAYQLTRGANDGAAAVFDGAGAVLPLVAPVLMALIPAKLFRPKHGGDWWAMHGVGMAGVCLAAAMTDDAAFVVLLALYAAATGWALVLYAFRRGAGLVPPMPNAAERPDPLLVDTAAASGPAGLLRRSLLWLAVATAIALPPFYLLPRSGGHWSFARGRIEIGLSADSTVDLNQTGDLEVNPAVAIEVAPLGADGAPPAGTTPDPEQLWRGMAYTEYADGKWAQALYDPLTYNGPRYPPLTPPAALGGGAVTLEFLPREAATVLVTAAPVRWRAGESPVATVAARGDVPWTQRYDTSFRLMDLAPIGQRYRQAYSPPAEPGLGPPFELRLPGGDVRLSPTQSVLVRVDVPAIRKWAVELLRRLAREGKVPPGAAANADPRAGFRVADEYHERVARAVRDHLAESGEFEYTTKLRRQDARIDPTADFLLNVKAGHCQRYATALVLVLRAVGIPAQYATGYKGWDAGEDGRLLLRSEHAHAWAEVLVARPPPPGYEFNPLTADRTRVWHWLSLDPTPGGGTAAAQSGNWFDQLQQQGFGFITGFITGYNAEQRQKLLAAAVAGWPVAVGGGVAVAVGIVLLVRVRRRFVPLDSPAVPWYRDYLHALARRGIAPAVGQTPKEFAATAAAALRAAGSHAADVPELAADLLYRTRYGGESLCEADAETVAAAVSRLANDRTPLAGGTA